MAWPGGGVYRVMRARPLRRLLALLVAWVCCCVVIYRVTEPERTVPREEVNVNSRLLLQQVTDVRVSPNDDNSTSQPLLEQILAMEPRLDSSPVISDTDRLASLQDRLPNVPLKFWAATKGKVMNKNKTCAKLPQLEDLKFNNLYWQVMSSSNGTYYFFSAYYDNRTTLNMKPLVRILGMIDRINPTLKTYCQIWFSDKKEPVVVPLMEYKYVWYRKWGNYKQGVLQPYLMACHIPTGYQHLVPKVVSVVEKPCDKASNLFRVVHNPVEEGGQKDFAVCVKGLDFAYEDLSVRLIEWIELLHILGASKIFMYELQVHPNISKVLKYYQDKGMVEVSPLTLPGNLPNLPGIQHAYLKKKITDKRQNELIPYNDCLYKNINRYRYLALLDTDEVIMPTSHESWKDLISIVTPLAKEAAEKSKKVDVASYNFQNVYFLDDLMHDHGWFKDIPRFAHMLQHVYRSRNFTKPGHYIKCFHRTDRVVTLHNHFPLACLGGCYSYAVNTSVARLQHYRADCVSSVKKVCKTEYKTNTVLDTNIWRFRDDLVARMTRTLAVLGFLPVDNRQLSDDMFKTAKEDTGARAKTGLSVK